MKYWIITGVLDCEHYTRVVKAATRSQAVDNFNDSVFYELAVDYWQGGDWETFDEAQTFVNENFTNPWIVMVAATSGPIDIHQAEA